MMNKLIAYVVLGVVGAAWAYLYSLTEGHETGLYLFTSMVVLAINIKRCKCKEDTAVQAGGATL